MLILQHIYNTSTYKKKEKKNNSNSEFQPDFGMYLQIKSYYANHKIK